jgi:hypothetical protein
LDVLLFQSLLNGGGTSGAGDLDDVVGQGQSLEGEDLTGDSSGGSVNEDLKKKINRRQEE